MSATRRHILFLQGPPGPFFYLLGRALQSRGLGVFRINLCGGDVYDWPEPTAAYRGTRRRWPLFIDRYLRDHAITDLVLFGDCRPLHRVALRIAQLRGVHIHVFEEGYIRPDWMTLERDGVNGHSPIIRDPQMILKAAAGLPPVPHLPRITANFRRRARDSYWHYHHVFVGRWRFPFFQSHRPGSLLLEGFGWLYKFAMAPLRARHAEAALARLSGQPFFLLPLQLSGDSQIRVHSPFGSMRVAADFVLESFARFAPPGSLLVVKEHPLEAGWGSWRGSIRRAAAALGVEGRVIHLDGGDLDALIRDTQGLVCVNSTSGTLALDRGKPVAVLGDAIYDVPGITHQSGLDRFWTAPERPDARLYDAFKRLLHARCLVRGGLASKSALATLVDNATARLLASDAGSAPR
ncbi:MAG: capsule biosynthesis protein [Chakrabartia sp.]